MGCLSNIVSIKGCGTADTRLYLQQVGITNEMITDILTPEYESIEEFVSEKVNFAVEQVTHDARNFYQPQISQTLLLRGGTVGHLVKGVNTTATNQAGIRLTICNTADYIDIYIPEITIHLNATQTITVTVYDVLQQREVLVVPNVQTTIGEPTLVPLDVTLQSHMNGGQWLITYDADGSDALPVSVFSCNGCAKGTTNQVCNWLNATGIVADDAQGTNLSAINNTGGVQLTYSIQCSSEGFLCQLRNQLALPILWKAAATIYHFAAYSARQFSVEVALKKEDAVERFEHAEAQYKHFMALTLQNSRMPNTRCFACKPMVGKFQFVPS